MSGRDLVCDYFFIFIIISSIPYMEGDDGRFSLHHLRQIVWAEDDVLLGITCRSRDQFNDCIVEFEMHDTILQEKLVILD